MSSDALSRRSTPPYKVYRTDRRVIVKFDLKQHHREVRRASLFALRDLLDQQGRGPKTRLRGTILEVRLKKPTRQPGCNDKINRAIDSLVNQVSMTVHDAVTGATASSRREQAMAVHPADTGPTMRRHPVGATLH